MVCEVGSAMDMSGEGAGAGASALQQRWYEGRVNGSPAAGDVNADGNGDGFFHSPLEGGHHSRARYYHQQMHAPYSAAVGSHGKFILQVCPTSHTYFSFVLSSTCRHSIINSDVALQPACST